MYHLNHVCTYSSGVLFIHKGCAAELQIFFIVPNWNSVPTEQLPIASLSYFLKQKITKTAKEKHYQIFKKLYFKHKIKKNRWEVVYFHGLLVSLFFST